MTESIGLPAPIVEMRGIVKRFPGVLANDHVDLTIYPREIHALLGENGAGKSTLMNILAGLYQPDEGQIVVHGQPVSFDSPRDAIAHGIGMVYQHFMLVEPQTVAENVILGLKEPRFVLNLSKVEAEIAAMSEQYELPVDPRAYIWQLSVGEQQRVEILKMLYRGAETLILDEPTAVLTPREVEQLFETISRLAEESKAIILITHKLAEVYNVADNVTVLRGGRLIGTTTPRETSEAELTKMMVGREVMYDLYRKPAAPGAAVLEIDGIQALNDKGLRALKDVSFAIREGEILGIAGVAGNGQRELAEVITGLRHADAGRVRVRGEEITNHSPYDIIRHGVSHVPEDRMGMGLAGNLPVSDNIILKAYRQVPLSNGPFLNRPSIRGFARRLIERFQIATPGPDTPVKLLSGGNLQKTILAREITAAYQEAETARGDSGDGAGTRPAPAPILVAVHPTRGLDVGATESVRKILLEQRDRGAAILLISEDLDELLVLCDRIAVLYSGQIMGTVKAEQANIEVIGSMMAGKGGEYNA